MHYLWPILSVKETAKTSLRQESQDNKFKNEDDNIRNNNQACCQKFLPTASLKVNNNLHPATDFRSLFLLPLSLSWELFYLLYSCLAIRDMIRLNNDKKNSNRTIPAATIFTLAIIMTISTIAAPAAATTTATTMPQPVTVATDNQSVNVLISWEPMEIEPGQDTVFTLDFQDPSSGESISHVNYNFEIKDQNGGTVQSMTDLHTHSGSDEQTVTFDTAGSFNVVATIIGTGLDPPFDTTQSGTAQTVITVGQQLAGATDGNNTAGTTDNITSTTGGVG